MKVSDLKPNELNPRKIDDWHLDALGKSLKKFGDLGCVVFNRRSKNLISGHMRVKQLPPNSNINIITNYLTPTPTGTVAEGFVEIDGERFNYREVDVDASTEKAMNIAANKHGGEFDLPKLNDWLLELDQENYDMDLLGFSPEELENVLVPIDYHGNTDEDDVPPLPKEPKSKLGDIYQLGDHRLMCGDSANIQHVERLMNGEKADMVFTDPPYGVSYQKKTEEIANQSKTRLTSKIEGDDLSLDELKDVLQAAFHNIYMSLADKSSYYVCSPQGGELGLMMMMMMQEACIPCRHMIIWVKNAPVFSMGRLDYDYRHEPILYGWSPKKTHEFNGKGDLKNSVWEISREPNKVHPTMKPLAIPENAILNSTLTGGKVLDLFGGSGTTLIASEKTNRKCFIMEIDPHYVDVIIERWEKFSGKKAQLING